MYIIEYKNGGDERKEINRDPQVPVTWSFDPFVLNFRLT